MACSRRSIRKTERGGKQCYIRSGVKKKKEEECFVHEATRPRLLFNFRSAATIELFNADSGFEFTFFNLDQSEVTRLSQITLLICQRVPEVVLLIVC